MFSENEILHKFPNPEKDAVHFRNWLYKVGGDIMGLENGFIFKRRRVCHIHFETRYHTRSKMLSADALPTLYLSGPLSRRAPLMDVTNQAVPTPSTSSSTHAEVPIAESFTIAHAASQQLVETRKLVSNTMRPLLLLLPACLALHDLEPPAPASARQDDVITGFMHVRVTHFHASNTDTFPMRYMYNPTLHQGPDPDIVIFVGGEWSISAGWVQAGLAYELAETLGAGLFYTEHRYYGETRPTSDTSVPSLRWLTVDQALADLAQFIQLVRSDNFEGGLYKNAKVVLVGCSYAGSMATWMRLAYPHLITAAFSDSGPLHAQEDFPEYLEMITEAIRVQGGNHCVDAIRSSMAALGAMMQSNPAQVSTMFNTCSELQADSALDRATFYWFGITETFAYLVQYATPGDIPAACEVLTDESVANAAQRLANWVTAQSWTQPCIETRYSEVVAQHTNTSYDATQAVMRLWTYQTCVEFGWYQTTSGEEQVFLNSVPLGYFHQMCKDFYSAYFNEDLLRSGIERTNLLFGGLTFLPDRVVSVAGGHDPWAPMGPNVAHQTPLAPVYVVPQVSHCRAVQPTGSSETQELEQVKQNVLNHLHQWTTGRPMIGSGAHSVLASIALVMATLVAAL